MSNTSLYRRRTVHNIYKRCSLEEEKCLSDEEKQLKIVGSTKKINKIGISSSFSVYVFVFKISVHKLFVVVFVLF